MTTPDRPVLRLDHVEKKYKDVTALSDVHLDVHRGEFLSLLGPSGCGKTTLLRMIAGFEQPTAGRIELDGKDLTALPPYRRPVNTVFQSYALFPHMSVAENVAYGLKRAKVPRREMPPRIKEALELVQMDHLANRLPQQLSGGQQQRVALARALVNRPTVLLLDEPMSALDRKLREEMQLELIRLHTDLGLTFLFVTHDQEEALAMSDRVVVLNQGIVQQVGSAEEIYQHPANKFVAGFIGTQNFVPATVIKRNSDSLILQGEREFLKVSGHHPSYQVADKVLAAIRPEHMKIRAGNPSSDTNEVGGIIIGESFRGDAVAYLVRLRDGHEILVRVPARTTPDISEGDYATVSWAEDAVQVFHHD
ncbi:polyamine ABC transporter ATP-binding protein [Corynebacterium sp. 3HC-13]|uniref:ABC transporter ATP-binding protein n=1 Tax=Corynebacterium poyangense TaxID=2684405 RepID=UPI001CC8FB02|nr:ABC transporter ATP-binding protein [Corynebacterium poyangense]MBZ8177392.1 polyamine ABC transporter ATP-binding protein [Corynebacterium poyangense]